MKFLNIKKDLTGGQYLIIIFIISVIFGFGHHLGWSFCESFLFMLGLPVG